MSEQFQESKDQFTMWEEVGVYSTEKDSKKPKWFQIFAYPAPSGFIHVGTLRSYTYPDVIAKFKRFTGHNVYFPGGIHASGLPAVQFSDKVRSGKYKDYLIANNATREIIETFQTPEGVVDFFSSNYAEIWKQMGFFINSETGIPTTIDPGYSKFIEWQFRTLSKRGYIFQREYVSSYCPNDGPVAIDTAETDLSSGGNAQIIEIIDKNGNKKFEFSEPVICRCGEPVQIRYVPDQWFIAYSNSNITSEVTDHVKNAMNIYPVSLHHDMPEIISWFSDRPCVRTGRWLGTKFPSEITESDNENLIIEPIADSTIYPAYYLISKYINQGIINANSFTDSFFDFIFLNTGDIKTVNEETNISEEIIHQIKTDFENWYPVDCNFGGKEHRTVHFPVYLKMHAMIFPKERWPKRIFVNWWVMQDIRNKSKIAKSKGGVGSATKIIEKYSADAIRLYYCHASSPHIDMEWSESKVQKYRNDINKIADLINEFQTRINSAKKEDSIDNIGNWFNYKMNSSFNEMYEYLKNFEIRKMTQICYYTIPKIIWRFINRNGEASRSMEELMKIWIMYISMITPFLAEKLYTKVGFEGSIFSADNIVTKIDLQQIPPIIEEEEFIEEVIHDIIKIKKVVKNVDKSKVFIITSKELFESNRSEEEVLISASPYISNKTGIIPIINSNDPRIKNKPPLRSRKPTIAFI